MTDGIMNIISHWWMPPLCKDPEPPHEFRSVRSILRGDGGLRGAVAPVLAGVPPTREEFEEGLLKLQRALGR